MSTGSERGANVSGVDDTCRHAVGTPARDESVCRTIPRGCHFCALRGAKPPNTAIPHRVSSFTDHGGADIPLKQGRGGL